MKPEDVPAEVLEGERLAAEVGTEIAYLLILSIDLVRVVRSLAWWYKGWMQGMCRQGCQGQIIPNMLCPMRWVPGEVMAADCAAHMALTALRSPNFCGSGNRVSGILWLMHGNLCCAQAEAAAADFAAQSAAMMELVSQTFLVEQVSGVFVPHGRGRQCLLIFAARRRRPRRRISRRSRRR